MLSEKRYFSSSVTYPAMGMSPLLPEHLQGHFTQSQTLRRYACVQSIQHDYLSSNHVIFCSQLNAPLFYQDINDLYVALLFYADAVLPM